VLKLVAEDRGPRRRREIDGDRDSHIPKAAPARYESRDAATITFDDSRVATSDLTSAEPARARARESAAIASSGRGVSESPANPTAGKNRTHNIDR
jgi:hypothetical protein